MFEIATKSPDMESRRALALILRQLASVALDYTFVLLDEKNTNVSKNYDEFVDTVLNSSQHLCELGVELARQRGGTDE